ncbi:MAG: hypothetical protein ACRD19_05345 [Terriglobia bacterium]
MDKYSRSSCLRGLAVFGIILSLASVPAAQAARVTISPGARLAVRLDNTISTKSAYHYFGNIINATLDEDVLDSRGRVALPAGSTVRLAMPECKRAGRVFGRASIRLRLFSVTLPDGSEVPLDGYATRLDNNKKPGREGTFHGRHSLVKDAAVDTTALAVGAGAGLAVGGPLGLPVGAAAGVLTASLWTVGRRGPDLALPAGTVIEFTLGRPASVDEPGREAENTGVGESEATPEGPVDPPDPQNSVDSVDSSTRENTSSADAAWGQGLAIPPSADLIALLNETGEPSVTLAALDKINFRNRSDSDRVFGAYLRGVCELELNHPKQALDNLDRAYTGAKRLNLPQTAQSEIARNLVLALQASSRNWQASPLMNDPALQAVLVAQEGGD